jgi:short-chain fatty acids transporter
VIGGALARFFRAVTPDPFVLAILLTLLTGLLALALTDTTVDGVITGWQGPSGFWKLLAFSMQMCLILVTGHALASTPLVRRQIAAVVALPKSAGAAGALVAFVAIATSLLNWGLALIVGALVAREMGRSCQRRGVRVHYPLLVAAGYTGLMCWHGGFSGSAPLKVTTQKDLVELLGAELGARTAPLSTFETILSPMNLVISGGLLVLVPVVIWFLSPRGDDEAVGIEVFDVAEDTPPAPVTPETVPERLEQSFFVTLLLVAPLAYGLALYFVKNGLSKLDPNAVNLVLLTAGLLLHKTPRAYLKAVQDAVAGCSGIILQFPLYAGIMGIMATSGLAKLFAGWAASTASASSYLVLTFLSAGFINFFVPSGGGQWAVQGPIAVQAAEMVGVPFSSAVMAVAYGDQWTNMLQPFWALPLLGITGVTAKDIIGYTAFIMFVAGLWLMGGLVLLG